MSGPLGRSPVLGWARTTTRWWRERRNSADWLGPGSQGGVIRGSPRSCSLATARAPRWRPTSIKNSGANNGGRPGTGSPGSCSSAIPTSIRIRAAVSGVRDTPNRDGERWACAPGSRSARRAGSAPTATSVTRSARATAPLFASRRPTTPTTTTPIGRRLAKPLTPVAGSRRDLGRGSGRTRGRPRRARSYATLPTARHGLSPASGIGTGSRPGGTGSAFVVAAPELSRSSSP